MGTAVRALNICMVLGSKDSHTHANCSKGLQLAREVAAHRFTRSYHLPALLMYECM